METPSGRSIIVFRHGKAEAHDHGGGDHGRALTYRGVREARAMGRYLTETGQRPDLVLASSALRARTTAELAAEEGEWDAPIDVRDELYVSEVSAVIDALEALPDDARCVVLAGHEPTSSALVAALSGAPRPHFPTAAMARIDFPGSSWRPLGTGTLAWLTTPKELEGRE